MVSFCEAVAAMFLGAGMAIMLMYATFLQTLVGVGVAGVIIFMAGLAICKILTVGAFRYGR